MKQLIISSLLSTFSFIVLSNIQTTSIYPLIIFAIVLFFYKKTKDYECKYIKIGSLVFGILAVLSLFQVGKYEDVLGNSGILLAIFKIIIVLFGTYYLAKRIMSILFSFFDNKNIQRKSAISSKLILLISFIFLLFIYLPVWLMEYPSNIGPDTINQINQIVNNVYTNHRPFMHTMWLKLLMSFGDDINTRVGAAAFIQMVLNAVVFSVINQQVYKRTKNIFISVCVLLFYGLLSFNAFMSVTLVKDVTHAMITCIYVILLINYFDSKASRKKVYLLFISLFSIFFCLFRSNGYYAFIIVILVSLVYSFKRKDYKLIISFVISFIISLVIKGPIYYMFGISSPSIVESLSVPIQQISMVIKNGKQLTMYEKEMISKIVDISKISESYDVFLSDPIKNLINNNGNLSYLLSNKYEYFRIWFGIGVRYPVDYLRGWINQVSAFFVPTYYATSFFWSVWTNNLGIVASPLLSGDIAEIFHSLAYTQHSIPMLGCFHYPSIYTWIMIVMLFYSMKNKDYESILIYSILFGLFITLLISCPYNTCFRYYYAVVCATPIIVVYSLLRKKINE